jgi:SET domain-containing protein
MIQPPKKLKIAKRRSPIHGNGVIATARIRKGEPIVEYKGRLITHAEADETYGGDINSGHTFLFTLNDEWIIDANVRGNVARWINTSCEPNAVAFIHSEDKKNPDPKKDRVIIEALRDIEPGEEITYDYGFEFDVPYTKALLRTWACRCGSKKCRGTMLSGRKYRAFVKKHPNWNKG